MKSKPKRAKKFKKIIVAAHFMAYHRVYEREEKDNKKSKIYKITFGIEKNGENICVPVVPVPESKCK